MFLEGDNLVSIERVRKCILVRVGLACQEQPESGWHPEVQVDRKTLRMTFVILAQADDILSEGYSG